MKITLKLALLFAMIALMVPVTQAGLIGHWTFDEATTGIGTGIAVDSSGKGHNGAIGGSAVYMAGHIGTGALTFDGTNDYVAVPYSAELALAGSKYTIAWWSKWDASTDAVKFMISNNNNTDYSGGGYDLYYHEGAFKATQLTGGYADSQSVTVPTTKFSPVDSVGTWVHLAVTYDGTDRNFYVNGDLALTAATPGALADIGSNPLYFGNGGTTYSQHTWWFNGVMDDIQIYNQPLTLSQVGTVMGGGVIPEPSTLILLGFGLLSLLAYAWRKQE